MKLRIRNPSLGAITVFEVMVVVVCVFFCVVLLAAALLPYLAQTKSHVQRINCVSNLRQINIAFRIWEGDNGNQYPMAVSVSDGGAMEMIGAGNLTACLQCASNEMCSPKLFVCPEDSARTFATNWNDLNRWHVSYFLGADARSDTNSNMVLDGDDNLIVGGMPVAPGLVNLSSNASLSWSGTRHGTIYRPHFWSSKETNGCGNLGFADGSVLRTTSNGLQRAFQGTGLATNRIVVP
jgi:hypothetical protein